MITIQSAADLLEKYVGRKVSGGEHASIKYIDALHCVYDLLLQIQTLEGAPARAQEEHPEDVPKSGHLDEDGCGYI
jgi:hypothetical protein